MCWLRSRKTSARATIVWIPGQVLLINLLIRFERLCPPNRNGNYVRVVLPAVRSEFSDRFQVLGSKVGASFTNSPARLRKDKHVRSDLNFLSFL